MTLTLDRMEIESVGSDPVALAAVLHAQMPDRISPVPIREIALALDIVSIEEQKLFSIEGCLQTCLLKDKGQIVVNAASPQTRKRYTIAHELGHFLNETHKPTQSGQFECSLADMSNPEGDPVHQRQEIEANRFAIEVLAPLSLMQSALAQAPDLERACDLANQLQISREATIRRYVEHHPDNLAAVFSRDGQIRYIVKGDRFPRTDVWSGNILPEIPLQPADGARFTDMSEADPREWLTHPRGKELSAQTLFQQNGYATTLLLLE